MYHFQSKNASPVICGDPVITFSHFAFDTDDEKIAERLRKNSKFGQDIWEVTDEELTVVERPEGPRVRVHPAPI